MFHYREYRKNLYKSPKKEWITLVDAELHIPGNAGFCFVLFCLFRATPVAYGGSQARGLIRAVATGLRQSPAAATWDPSWSATYTTAHGNAGSLTH